MQDIISALSIGLGVWLFSWGINRVYLTIKSFLG